MSGKVPDEESATETTEAFGETALTQKAVRTSIVGSFMILVVGVLYFAKSVLLPVTLAFLFALILSPIVRTLKRRGIPESITATLLILAVSAVVGVAGFTLSGPISTWLEDAPQIGSELRWKLSSLREPVENIKRAQKQVEEATEPTTEPTFSK